MQTAIIIPCYNESARLPKESFQSYAVNHPEVIFLFVNDGSDDDTLQILQSLCTSSDNFQYYNLRHNVGKAEAVRQGILHTVQNYSPDFVGFWDADLATPICEMDEFIHYLSDYQYNMITGLRLMRLGAKVSRKTFRHFLGRCFATVASNMLHIPVYDTQCGAKLYGIDIIHPLFDKPFISKWLFDVELLARYIQHYGKEAAITKIYEYPVFQWHDVADTKLHFRDYFRAPFEMIKIHHKYFR